MSCRMWTVRLGGGHEATISAVVIIEIEKTTAAAAGERLARSEPGGGNRNEPVVQFVVVEFFHNCDYRCKRSRAHVLRQRQRTEPAIHLVERHIDGGLRLR